MNLFLQAFFKEELAPHFDPGALDSVTASKRQMTFFLSYMARVAAFWEASDGLSRNVFDLHQGSVLFEAVSAIPCVWCSLRALAVPLNCSCSKFLPWIFTLSFWRKRR